MDKLSVLADFEKRAEGEELENDEVRLFLLLLVTYDSERQCGEIRRGAIAAALARGFFPAGLNRACRRLSALGLSEVVLAPPEGITGEDALMVYRILT